VLNEDLPEIKKSRSFGTNSKRLSLFLALFDRHREFRAMC